jgi:hypothetical protein
MRPLPDAEHPSAQQRKLWDETPLIIHPNQPPFHNELQRNLVTWLVDWIVVLETFNLTDRKTWYTYLGDQ